MTLKKALLTVMLLCSLSILVVLALYWQSLPDSAIKNGFNRNIRSAHLQIKAKISLGSANYDFAGWIGNRIYLRNVDVPYALVEVQENFISDTIHLSNPLTDKISNAQIHIDSPFFYIGDLNNYVIYKGHTNNWVVQERVDGPEFFSEYLPVNDSIIAYRTVTDSKKEYRLITESAYQLIDGTGLIQTQIDGLFCTDGMLRFDQATHSIVYTYFYRNQFIRANSKLQLLGRNHTIDTTRHAKISVAYNTKDKYASLSSPPKLVNRAVECSRGKLLVNSNLIADNDSHDTFQSADVIDVYDLKDGSYLSSFYVPRNDGVRFTHFEFHENQLFILRGNVLEIYEPNPSLIAQATPVDH
jgi:hypothetical protein